jgi:hypothetical protein
VKITRGLFLFVNLKRGEKNMEAFLIGLVTAGVTTALTTIISIVIKHSYSTRMEKEKEK